MTKCEEMVFDFSKENRNFPLLVIDNTEVECANSARTLGVMIQNYMNWWEHVTKIVKKAKLVKLLVKRRPNCRKSCYRGSGFENCLQTIFPEVR